MKVRSAGRLPRLVLVLFAAAMVSPPTASAQDTQNRCLVLGPLAVSSYIAVLEQIAAGNRDESARQSQNAANIMTLYERMECPQKPLISAIECLSSHVVSSQQPGPVIEVAEQCMKNAGMPTR